MIFGVQSPKFISSTGLTVELDSAIILKDEPIGGYDVTESPLNLMNFFIGRGANRLFQVKIHLWKYLDPQVKFETITQFHYDMVTLFRHKDGLPFRNYNEEIVRFFFSEYKIVYETNTDYKDAVILTFLSEEPVSDYRGGILDPQNYQYLVDDDGNFLVDDDGNKILGKKGAEIIPD